MEAGDEMRKFSHFFTFSPTVGIRYRATVGVGESTFIPLTRHPKRIVNTPVTKATNLLSVFSLLSFSLLFSAIATTLPFLVLSLLFAAFPSRAAPSPHSILQPCGHKKYFYAFLEIFFLPSVRHTNLHTVFRCSFSPPPYYSTGGQEWREV